MKLTEDTRIIRRLFFRLLPVQILIVAIGGINSIIDGAMGSHYVGAQAMAVIGLFLPILRLIETINAVMQGGAQILSGQYLGRNQPQRAQQIFSIDLLTIVLFSGTLSLFCLLAPHTLSGWLGTDPALHETLAAYIRGVSIGIVPQILVMQLSAFLQFEQQEKRTYIGIFSMMLFNTGLDYLFMKVIPLGMFGLGLATSVSNWIFFLIQASYYIKKTAVIQFSGRSLKFADIVSILKIGIPGALSVFCAMLRSIFLNTLLQRLSGADGIAALSALNTLGILFYATTAGIAAVTRLLISVYYGEEDKTSMQTVMRIALTWGLGIVCAVAGLVFILAKPMTLIFFPDPQTQVYHLTLLLLRIFPLSIPLSAICLIFVSYYQSCSRMMIVNILSTADGVVGIVAASLCLAPVLGTAGIWWAHVLSGVFTLMVIWFYTIGKGKRIPTKFAHWMTIPKDFGVPARNYLALTIHNMHEVVRTSETVSAFCQQHAISRRDTYFASLCMEEMAANVVAHGFHDGKKHTADIRVAYLHDRVLLRITDDCLPFNPKEWLEMIDPQDKTHNLGIRMANSLSSELSYQYLYGLNVLTMELSAAKQQGVLTR